MKEDVHKKIRGEKIMIKNTNLNWEWMQNIHLVLYVQNLYPLKMYSINLRIIKILKNKNKMQDCYHQY